MKLAASALFSTAILIAAPMTGRAAPVCPLDPGPFVGFAQSFVRQVADKAPAFQDPEAAFDFISDWIKKNGAEPSTSPFHAVSMSGVTADDHRACQFRATAFEGVANRNVRLAVKADPKKGESGQITQVNAPAWKEKNGDRMSLSSYGGSIGKDLKGDSSELSISTMSERLNSAQSISDGVLDSDVRVTVDHDGATVYKAKAYDLRSARPDEPIIVCVFSSATS